MVKHFIKKKIYVEEKEEYYHNSIFNIKIEMSNIKLAGKGVITEEFIPKNSFIDYYTGNIFYYNKCGAYFVEINDKVSDHTPIYHFVEKDNQDWSGIINISQGIIKQY